MKSGLNILLLSVGLIVLLGCSSDVEAPAANANETIVEWFVDGETGLPLNPNAAPADGRFVLVGTLMAINLADVAAPQASIRLPSEGWLI